MEKMRTGSGAFEEFLARTGLSEEQALGLLAAAFDRQEKLRERARQVINAMEAIGDESFTVETLRAQPEALREAEEGAPVGEIYRKYFLKRAPMPRAESEANLGLASLYDDALTEQEIERISEYVARTGKRYEMD